MTIKDKKLLFELENKKSKKLLWGLLNVLIFGWLIIPFFVGILQLLSIDSINNEIFQIKYK